MPDIDIDFTERRQEVIDYVTNKYGHDKAEQIITFYTMAARGATRDVGRAKYPRLKLTISRNRYLLNRAQSKTLTQIELKKILR